LLQVDLSWVIVTHHIGLKSTSGAIWALLDIFKELGQNSIFTTHIGPMPISQTTKLTSLLFLEIDVEFSQMAKSTSLLFRDWHQIFMSSKLRSLFNTDESTNNRTIARQNIFMIEIQYTTRNLIHSFITKEKALLWYLFKRFTTL